MFVLNLILALVWAALTADFSPLNLFVGYVGGYFILYMLRRVESPSPYFRRLPRILRLIAIFLRELVVANLRVCYDVLTPTHYMKPAILAIPLDLESDEEITLLANLITLTPGTLSLDISTDRKVLYIHAMYVDDLDQARREIKQGFEREVREVFR
ncbi:MAG TPA: Na+/H+ antiporter subunit E [Candidatus Sumerlaeota bacterium]|nr:MAG: Na(+)/H(+) antiporter subunit E [candidate division BRC1 bacterium ADurb.BinA292]HOE96919.1 Na+/H+ antiporter subunit E [Candidatus Sumerlaeota bacterium]HOR27652.1 Na+/H+ antiporter subunit E [Candidatus Sumerlaeota bacterium]HPK02971.1 Na+/H+ antiporter subunit E [Candidatus Sumerlaeota bacterium]